MYFNNFYNAGQDQKLMAEFGILSAKENCLGYENQLRTKRLWFNFVRAIFSQKGIKFISVIVCNARTK